MNNQSFSTNNGNSRNSGISNILNSNNLVAKIAFLLIVVILFIILLQIGITILSYIFKPQQSPHLIDGMVDATQMLIFKQSNGKTQIIRSDNASDGIEFTWSVWINIDNLQYLAGQYKHIFYKGNNDLANNGLNFPNNAPGLYIAPDTNELVVMMNTYSVINEEIIIPNIPLNKWVNVIIRCHNTTLDVYINGTITRSIQLSGVPKQNYGDVYVGMNGGFQGNISNLWYYNYALGAGEIQNISTKGPNINMVTPSTNTSKLWDYLSLRWFFDEYNFS